MSRSAPRADRDGVVAAFMRRYGGIRAEADGNEGDAESIAGPMPVSVRKMEDAGAGVTTRRDQASKEKFGGHLWV